MVCAVFFADILVVEPWRSNAVEDFQATVAEHDRTLELAEFHRLDDLPCCVYLRNVGRAVEILSAFRLVALQLFISFSALFWPKAITVAVVVCDFIIQHYAMSNSMTTPTLK